MLEKITSGWYNKNYSTYSYRYALAPYQNAAETAFYLEVTGRADAMPQPDLTADAE